MSKKILFRLFSILFWLPFAAFILLSESPLHGTEDPVTGVPELLPPAFLKDTLADIDKMLESMTLDEKIGQLFIAPLHFESGAANNKYIMSLVKDYHIGGVVLFRGDAEDQVREIRRVQVEAKIPLFVSIDGEWGPGMRSKGVRDFPKQLTIGAVTDDALVFEMGQEIGRQCKRMGINMNFAPVVDVNNNPSNPVINYRSFGEIPENVARKGFAYMAGMQQERVIATAKHFPGHGNTTTDSHHTLPIINADLSRMDSVELYPFKQLINNGLSGVMVAHMHVPALDSDKNSVTSLSEKVIKQYLIDSLGFKGLIITDALNMAGAATAGLSTDVDMRAFKAGNDILLMSSSITASIKKFKKAVESGEITIEILNAKVRKILYAKKWSGVFEEKLPNPSGLLQELNTERAEFITNKIFENALTLVKNEGGLIPFYRTDTMAFASISVGTNKINRFQKYLKAYTGIDHYALRKDASESIFDAMVEVLAKKDVVMVGIHNTNTSPKGRYGINTSTIRFVNKLAQKTKVVLVLFGNPYAADLFSIDRLKGLLIGYQDLEVSRGGAAELIFGGIAAKGKLPVSINAKYPAGYGLVTEQIRMKYALPYELNINSELLKSIDSIVAAAIKIKAMPGCQIVAAKDGKIFYKKSYGYHTYFKTREVEDHHLYDLASITKIAATVPSLMKLVDDKKVNVNGKLSDYIEALDTTNKSKLKVKEVLAHYTNLQRWIPFYLRTMDGGKPDPEMYATDSSGIFSVRVAKNMFTKPSMQDTMFDVIYNSKLKSSKRYRYSDLGFYLFKNLVEEVSGTRLDSFVTENFYEPMGLNSLVFNPLNKFDASVIVPTENDTHFRNQLVHGYVHDYGAAMLGGVGGHAGLFGNATDLAALMQMYLQKGYYGGMDYVEPQTIALFTSCAFCKKKIRRGYGFDKPPLSAKAKSIPCKCASPKSFGHTGFTGTMAWVDPTNGLVFVFLSNRIYPSMTNKKLMTEEVRSKIHEVFYKAIKKGSATKTRSKYSL